MSFTFSAGEASLITRLVTVAAQPNLQRGLAAYLQELQGFLSSLMGIDHFNLLRVNLNVPLSAPRVEQEEVIYYSFGQNLNRRYANQYAATDPTPPRLFNFKAQEAIITLPGPAVAGLDLQHFFKSPFYNEFMLRECGVGPFYTGLTLRPYGLDGTGLYMDCLSSQRQQGCDERELWLLQMLHPILETGLGLILRANQGPSSDAEVALSKRAAVVLHADGSCVGTNLAFDRRVDLRCQKPLVDRLSDYLRSHRPTCLTFLVRAGGQAFSCQLKTPSSGYTAPQDQYICWVEPDPMPDQVLSPAETEVLECCIRGLTTDQMATHLYVTANTVKTHLKNLYRKLGVSSRTQMVSLALKG